MFRIIAISSFLFLSSFLFGQRSMSLQDCIKLALEKNLSLQESDLTIQNGELTYEQSKKNRYPNLTGFGGLNYNFGRTIDPTTNEFLTQRFTSNNYGLSSGALLYGGSRIKNAILQSELDLEALKQDRKQTEADIALQVATAYLNTLFAIENINVAKAQLTQTEEQLDFINKLIDAGARPRNENLDIIAQISANKQNIIIADNSKQLSLLQLKQLMRISPDEELILMTPDDIEVITDPNILTFSEVYELTLRSQPAVQAAMIRQESAQYNVDIAKADMLPTLSIGSNLSSAYSNRGFRLDGTQQRQINQEVIIGGNLVTITTFQDIPVTRDANFGEQLQDNVSLGVGLSLNVPIYNRGQTKTNIQRAELGVKSGELALQRVKESIQILVQQTLADAKASKNALAASQVTVEARKAALDNAIKKFEAGALNSFELTTIQTQYDNASVNYLIDKYNYLFAIKVLEFYMGKPIKL